MVSNNPLISNNKTPINLKNLYGKRYKIGLDPAAQHEDGGKKDPWYYLILCKAGNIYPYSGELLAFHCMGGVIRNRLYKEHPEIQMRNEADDGEAIFLFPIELFDIVAEYAKPRKKRQISANHLKKLTESNRAYRFKRQNNGSKVAKTAQISMLEGN